MSRLEPSVIRPICDLSRHVLEPLAGPRVVHGDVLLGPVGQSLEIDIHIGPVTVHTRDLEVAIEVAGVQPRQREPVSEAVHGKILGGESSAIRASTLRNVHLDGTNLGHHPMIRFGCVYLRSSGVHVIEDFSA